MNEFKIDIDNMPCEPYVESYSIQKTEGVIKMELISHIDELEEKYKDIRLCSFVAATPDELAEMGVKDTTKLTGLFKDINIYASELIYDETILYMDKYIFPLLDRAMCVIDDLKFQESDLNHIEEGLDIANFLINSLQEIQISVDQFNNERFSRAKLRIISITECLEKCAQIRIDNLIQMKKIVQEYYVQRSNKNGTNISY
jgi:hypothetical protein